MTPILVCKSLPQAGNSGFSAAQRAKGFTLIEILMVLSIIAMISFVVVPNFTGLESRTFSAQVREARSLLNYARRNAVVTGQPSTASFLVTSNEQSDTSSREKARSSVGQWKSNGTRVTYRDSTDRDVEVEDKVEITFYPEGGSTGGSIILETGERTATLKIDSITGKIESELDDES
jgi:general secretion pathway protein H